MVAFDPATLDRWRALAIVDRDGATVGTVGEFYLDRETGHPTWALVNTGLFGGTQTFVPLVDATEISDGLQVPYEKRHIKDAPQIDPHDELTPDEEATLFAHYGVAYRPSSSPDPGPAGSPSPDPATAGSPGALTGLPGAEAPGWPESPGSPGTVTGEPGVEFPGSPGTLTGTPAAEPQRSPDEARPGSPEGIPSEPETTDPTTGNPSPNTVPAEPETTDPASGSPSSDAVLAEPETTGPGQDTPRAEASTGTVPAEPGTPDPTGGAPSLDTVPADPVKDEAWRVGPSGAQFGRGEDHGGSTYAGADLSRPAPVEPWLPGSTSTTPLGTTRTTLDPDAASDPSGRTPGEAAWAPAPGSIEEPAPADRPVGGGDHWREAELAAERDRIAPRTAAAQPEDRSPLERAKRRLERLVGGGQTPAEPEDPAASDRNRLGLDEDDRRRR